MLFVVFVCFVGGRCCFFLVCWVMFFVFFDKEGDGKGDLLLMI